MLELGKVQELVVIKKVDFGVYLSESVDNKEEKVLLPIKQVPEGTGIGDKLEVFLYRDSSDRPIATTRLPKLTLGEVAKCRVVSVSKIGAFLDWGLEKDLFLPYKEQIFRVNEGDEVLVALYLDKSSRLCSTMKIYHYLKLDSPYEKDDEVSGTVYEISDRFGAFVAVDDKYSGLIPKKEYFGEAKIGQTINARVTAKHEDGKLNLAVRKKAYLQLEEDSLYLEELLKKNKGMLPFTDKVSPELIREKTNMSKNEFKRAVGHLLKEKKIVITDKSIQSIGL